MCNGPKTNCRLTLKLDVTTDVVNTTQMSGSTPISTYLVTTTSLVGDGITAIARIQLPTPTQSSKQEKFRGRPSETNSTSEVPVIETSKALDLGKDHEPTDSLEAQSTPETENNGSSSQITLTTAQITGVVAGSVAFLLVSSLGLFSVLRYRKRRLSRKNGDDSGVHEKTELDGNDSCSPSELASKLDVTELPADIQAHELSASRDIFELYSEPVSGGRSVGTVSIRRSCGGPGSKDRANT